MMAPWCRNMYEVVPDMKCVFDLFYCILTNVVHFVGFKNMDCKTQGRRLRVASGATAQGPALEGAPRFRLMSLSSCILR